jgi:hypothetical protein
MQCEMNVSEIRCGMYELHMRRRSSSRSSSVIRLGRLLSALCASRFGLHTYPDNPILDRNRANAMHALKPRQNAMQALKPRQNAIRALKPRQNAIRANAFPRRPSSHKAWRAQAAHHKHQPRLQTPSAPILARPPALLTQHQTENAVHAASTHTYTDRNFKASIC